MLEGLIHVHVTFFPKVRKLNSTAKTKILLYSVCFLSQCCTNTSRWVWNHYVSSATAMFWSNPDFCSRYESALKETRRIGIRKSFVQGMMIGLIMLFMFGTYALAFWWVCLNDRKLRQPIKFCGIYCFSILKTSNVTPL